MPWVWPHGFSAYISHNNLKIDEFGRNYRFICQFFSINSIDGLVLSYDRHLGVANLRPAICGTFHALGCNWWPLCRCTSTMWACGTWPCPPSNLLAMDSKPASLMSLLLLSCCYSSVSFRCCLKAWRSPFIWATYFKQVYAIESKRRQKKQWEWRGRRAKKRK